MDRAIASGAIGREFESLRAHQISSCLGGFFVLNSALDLACGGIVGYADGEVDGDSGFGFDRLSVLRVGLEAPFAAGFLPPGRRRARAPATAQGFPAPSA